MHRKAVLFPPAMAMGGLGSRHTNYPQAATQPFFQALERFVYSKNEVRGILPLNSRLYTSVYGIGKRVHVSVV